jgi:hypothetical protein
LAASISLGSPDQLRQPKKKSTRSSIGWWLLCVRCITVSGSRSAGVISTPISSAASRHAAACTDSSASTCPAAATAQYPSR